MQEKNVPGSRRTALGRQGSCPGRARPFIRFIRYAPTLNGDSASSFSRSVSGASARGTSSTSTRRRPSATHCLPCKQSIEVAVSALFSRGPSQNTFMCNMRLYASPLGTILSLDLYYHDLRHPAMVVVGSGVPGFGVPGFGVLGVGVPGLGVPGLGAPRVFSFLSC